ncbi:unnamed protein product [Linum tenue]|uniref:Uncharacterized protein n=1 Tax=Linum tenue TaxID=586396 RepID=A0AAV0I9Y9_9ROSI|nr:unnamed protein product [Linum tenue]
MRRHSLSNPLRPVPVDLCKLNSSSDP